MDIMSDNPNKSLQQIEVPQLYEKPFVPSKIEKIAMFISYPIAFLYTYVLLPSYNDGSQSVITAIFTLLFCASAELFYHKQKATKESFIWLGSIVVLLVSMLLGRNQVWGNGLALFFIHCYAV